MPRTIEQILDEQAGVLIFNLIKQIAVLRAENERLKEQLPAEAPAQEPPAE